VKKTKWVSLDDIPLEEVLEMIETEERHQEEKSRGLIRFVSWIWD
jgi:hypothetical protein